MCLCVCVCVCAQLHFFVTTWTIILQAPLSRPEHWSGLPFPSSTGSSLPNLSWWGRIWSLAPTTFKEYPGLDPALGPLSKGVWTSPWRGHWGSHVLTGVTRPDQCPVPLPLPKCPPRGRNPSSVCLPLPTQKCISTNSPPPPPLWVPS